MKFTFSRTYKIGNLTINLYPREILLIYSGEKRSFVRSFRRIKLPSLPRLSRLRSFYITLVASLFVIFFVSMGYLVFSTAQVDSSAADDDKMKNEILQSSATDFSQPGDEGRLEYFEHTVKPKESLSTIARRYGVSIDTICGSNSLKSYDYIDEGRKLRIPNRDGIILKMSKGTSIAAIARNYNVSLEKILIENSLSNPDFVPEGQELFIPDAKPQNIAPGFIWPVASRSITCGYGWRTSPFDQSEREFHQGLDIRASYQWVNASRYGKVTYTGWMGGYGNAVVIAHPNGYKTLYAHLSHVSVRTGQYVKQGQTIAQSGNTGRSTGAHLHFEIIKNGSHCNPYPHLAKKY